MRTRRTRFVLQRRTRFDLRAHGSVGPEFFSTARSVVSEAGGVYCKHHNYYQPLQVILSASWFAKYSDSRETQLSLWKVAGMLGQLPVTPE